MTSLTLSSSKNSNLGGFILILLIAMVIAFSVSMITYTSHAVERHGIEEVYQIRTCIRNNGPTQTWRSKIDPQTYYHICLLPDGRYGLQIVVEKVRECIEKTCFIPRDGSWSQVTDYLSKFATRFNGNVPH